MNIKFRYIFSLSFCIFFFSSIISIQAQEYNTKLSLNYKEIDSLMYAHYKKRELEQAIDLMKGARAKAKLEFGEQDSIFAEYTAYLGFFYKKNSQYDKALPFLIETKNIREKVLGLEHPDYAKAVNNLASIYQKMGNYDKALPLYIQAKDIREKVLGLENPIFATALNNLALLHETMGNYDKALPLFIQAKNIQEKTLGVEHPNFGVSLNNIAFLYKNLGNYEKALPLFIQAKNIREKALGKEHIDFALALNNLAVLYEKMEDYGKALILFRQAKNIFEQNLGQEHPDFATALNNIALLHQLMNNSEEALPLFIQAKDIREKVLGKEHPDFATSLNNIASLYTNMGNYDEALPLFIQAKDIQEKTLGKTHPNFANSLNNLASLYLDTKNYDEALPLFIQAKDIQEKTLGKTHPSFANSLNNLASLYIDMSNYEKAWESTLESVHSFSKLKLSKNINKSWVDSLIAADCLSNIYLVETIGTFHLLYILLKKDPSVVNSNKKQLLIADLTQQLLNKLRNKVSTEQDKLRLLNISNILFKNSLAILDPAQDVAKAFELSDQNKSVLLLQATKSEEVYRLGELPDSLVLQDKKRLQKQSKLQAQLLEQRSEQEKDSLRNLLIKVNQEVDDFLLLIKKKYPKYYALKYKQTQTNPKDIQQLLGPNTALLEYAIADSVVHIFYLDQNHIQWVKSVVPYKELNQRIQKLHNALSNYKLITQDEEDAYKYYTDQAYWFYQKLIEPVLKNKHNINNLIIVTDGNLGHLPFETFLTEAAPQKVTSYSNLHYLLNDYKISYNYSTTLWKENIDASSPKNNGQILAMAANYSYKIDSSLLNYRLLPDQSLRDILNPLPAARQEVETLQKEFKGFFAFDSIASEKMIKKLAPDYAIIHLAMHGILDHKRPVLSSLAFTEDNDSTESNFWQAHEISKMQLNANLVVLSACQTGFGKFETGNGIASLARAFMYAGAPSLIVSLWQVNDKATSKIMQNLYNNLATGMNKDEALAQAKLQYIKAAKGIAAHPAFWSPFIQIGNIQPVHISKKGMPIIWKVAIGIGGFIVLSIILLLILKNRKKEVS